MAYNILKGDVQFVNSTSGTIESMVDDHSNQTIGGMKTFSNAITASGGISSTVYSGTNINSTSGSFAELTISSSVNHTPLMILDKAEASSSFIEFRKEGVKHAEIRANSAETFIIKTEATSYPIWIQQAANKPLKFQDSLATFESYPVHISQSLHVTGSSYIGNLTASSEISASAFYGSGQGLVSIPASGLNLGDSTDNSGGNLIVKLSSSGGLESTSNGLRINASLATVKSSPEDNDKFIISDSGAGAGNAPKYMLYSVISAAVASGITTYPPNGNNGEIQFKNGSAFQGDAGLVYASATDTLTTVNLTASGYVSSSNYFGDGSKLSGLSTTSYGFFTFNFTAAAENDFIGIVTTGSAITASLPAAASFNPGKRFTFKDVSGSCSGSNHIVISASLNSSGESIDGEGIVKIKSAYGSVTIVSDGLSQYYIESVN